MQSDDVIWSVINQQFCSYKVKCVQSISAYHISTNQALFEGLLRRTFAETNIMSQDFVTGRVVRWRTHDTPRCGRKKASNAFSFSLLNHSRPNNMYRYTVSVCEDNRASTYPEEHVGTDKTVQQLLESSRAGPHTSRLGCACSSFYHS